jgi:DMSO/TMAO reductase YedYZ molybdopterin-dependent catalytic subunit
MIISRRKLIVSGLAATAGASGLAVAARLGQKYGLVPPDHGGIFGLGETLTYSSQRLLTRHSLAREFPRNQISPRPFPNYLDPLTEDFKRLQAGGFADYRLSIDGMVHQPVYVSMEPDTWDSIDMADALHPQTFLCYGLNGSDLPVPHGGPLRMRLPRQIGYKNIKFINRLTITDNLKRFGKGLGSAAAEAGYAWYTGI